MNSATQTQREPEAPVAATARPPRVRWLLATLMIVVPLLAGIAWHFASDDPMWPVFRASLNLCDLRLQQLAPVSPDGRYKVHVVQATCAARFPETMVFVTDAEEAFSAREVDPNRAVLEVAGLRTLDAAVWVPATESPTGREYLRIDLLQGSEHQVHRVESRWHDLAIVVGQSRPAPGAEKLAY